MIHTEPSWKSYLVETTEPIFTPEQCDIISKLGRSMPPQNAQVGVGSGGKYDTKTRISHISWIPFNHPDAIPMYKKLEDMMHKTNRRHFGFERYVLLMNKHNILNTLRVVFTIGILIVI
jgi:hypothetical protein